ncbi:MAG: hypothetical protein F4149_18480 [Gammaproteobacteria bacterium]|nr:hypothetical protein [Gammaproteobacteria bacterium]MYK82076.1 hypothetical protein [Gammaproteobacteria bacterium]
MSRIVTVREHESLASSGLDAVETSELAEFARDVLKQPNGDLAASKFVGMVTTRKGTALEILPKIDLDHEADDLNERTRQVFLEMLRSWRRTPKQLPESDIRSLSRFPMLEVFVRQFLILLTTLIRGGLARRYINVEENLPYLRGRLLFDDHLRRNASNRARFYTSHDELSVNRPANRLIHAALHMLAPRIRDATNQQLLRQSLIALAEVPPSHNPLADWRSHNIDRSMSHYQAVMQWVRLIVFQRGLATFSGSNTNLSLLFPMEQVFEDFLVASFRRHQQHYGVVSQGLRKSMATIDDQAVFSTQPDIALRAGSKTRFILDAKWKEIDATTQDLKHGITQSDVYQLHAYAARYGCSAVALVYPRNAKFESTLRYRFFDGPALLAVPFDVTQPQESVRRTIEALRGSLPNSASAATAA